MRIENYIQFDNVNNTISIVISESERIDITKISYDLAQFLNRFQENVEISEEFFALNDDYVLKIRNCDMSNCYIFTINKKLGFYLELNRINDLIFFLYTKDFNRYEHLKNPIKSFKDLES